MYIMYMYNGCTAKSYRSFLLAFTVDPERTFGLCQSMIYISSTFRKGLSHTPRYKQ